MKRVSAKNRIIVGLTLILLMTGCGLKANPVLQASAVSQKQSDQKLAASVDGNNVLLTWLMENPDRKISHLTIEKSQLGSRGNICRKCPRTFEKIGLLTVHGVMKKEYQFTDSLVEKGIIYSYRLQLCDQADVCRESQTVEIDFK